MKKLGVLGDKSHDYTCIYGDIYISEQNTISVDKSVHAQLCFPDANWIYLYRLTWICSINSLNVLCIPLWKTLLYSPKTAGGGYRNSLARPDRLHSVLLARPSLSSLSILHRVFISTWWIISSSHQLSHWLHYCNPLATPHFPPTFVSTDFSPFQFDGSPDFRKALNATD